MISRGAQDAISRRAHYVPPGLDRGRLFCASKVRARSEDLFNGTRGKTVITVSDSSDDDSTGSPALALIDPHSARPKPVELKHPFVRAGLHETVGEVEEQFADRAEQFKEFALNMASFVLFDDAFNAEHSALQLQPTRTKNGRASPFPVLEPSRPMHVAHTHRMISLAHDNYLDNQDRETLFKLGPKNLWDKLCANTKAQSAWLRIMLQEGIVTADDILDQSNTGLLSLYRKTVTTQNAAIAVRVLEHWFTGCPSGAQGLLSRISQELHRNGVILHSLYGDQYEYPLPVPVINSISARSRRHKQSAKNKQHQKAAERGAKSEAALCSPDAIVPICNDLIDHAEQVLQYLTQQGGAFNTQHLIPCVTIDTDVVAKICAALNATLIASTMARKCAVVSVRVCDVQPPLAGTELQAADACCIDPHKDKTRHTTEKVWPISQRVHKVLSMWVRVWGLCDDDALIPRWAGRSVGTMRWCQNSCQELLGVGAAAPLADRVAALESVQQRAYEQINQTFKTCRERAFRTAPSSAEINAQYFEIFHSSGAIANVPPTEVHITTQKWRSLTFTASVLVWERDARGSGQPTPEMQGLAGARHPARMCVDIPSVRHAVSAAAGTPGEIADRNYMLVPWPEMCVADAVAAVAAETAVSPGHTRGRDSSGSGGGAGGRNVRQRVSPAAVPAPTVRLPKMHRTAYVPTVGPLAKAFSEWFGADIGSGYSALKAKYRAAPSSIRKRWRKELAKDCDSD